MCTRPLVRTYWFDSIPVDSTRLIDWFVLWQIHANPCCPHPSHIVQYPIIQVRANSTPYRTTIEPASIACTYWTCRIHSVMVGLRQNKKTSPSARICLVSGATWASIDKWSQNRSTFFPSQRCCTISFFLALLVWFMAFLCVNFERLNADPFYPAM